MKRMRQQTVEVVDAYICDRCGRESGTNDPEAHEFISIDSIAGFDSVFGDGNKVALDLCQHCLKETLGAWIRIEQPKIIRGALKGSVLRYEKPVDPVAGDDWDALK